MASPKVVEPSGTMESNIHEEGSAPDGWMKKLTPKKTGTPKRKDVVYVAPNGEEIRNKRQLEKYLKVHPGGASVADFDWSTGETPRRSARLSTKGRLSSESAEAEPASKRSKVDSEDEAYTVRPGRKTSRKKSGPQAVSAGKDEIMADSEKAEGDVALDAMPAEEKIGPTGSETVENNINEIHGETNVQLGNPAEQTSIEISADKVNAEETLSKTEETVIVTNSVMEEGTVVEEVAVTLEQSGAIEMPGVDEVGKPSEGGTSLNEGQEVMEVEVQDILDVPATENLNGKDDDPLKPKEHIESQGIHALIEESVLAEVTKSPEQQTDPSLPAAEVERRGCIKSKGTGSRKLEQTNDIPIISLPDNGSSTCKVTKGPWNPTDSSHVLAVKTALHLSAIPDTILCREAEENSIINFCKTCIMEQRAGSIYICGCPGTGKSLTIENVKLLCSNWTKEAGTLLPETVAINCTSLTDPRHIYVRLLQTMRPHHNSDESYRSHELVMKELKQLICDSTVSKTKSPKRMLLLIVDEMDYLITRDQSVLYELFRLATFANSRLVLIGIANAIDLTDRLLPKLRSMNCKVDVITFPAYTKDQILAVLQQRLLALPFYVFQSAALELCARKVAAATGDMRKALHVCRERAQTNCLNHLLLSCIPGHWTLVLSRSKVIRSAIELAESEAHSKPDDEIETLMESSLSEGRQCSVVILDSRSTETSRKEPAVVGIDTMARALSQIFRSPVVETIQALPRHQQMVLCAAIRRFRHRKKDCSLGELNAGYLEFCKSTGMQALATPEFSSVCQVLADQALLTLGTSREDRLRRVTLKVDEEEVAFALQGVRFFQNCLQ